MSSKPKTELTVDGGRERSRLPPTRSEPDLLVAQRCKIVSLISLGTWSERVGLEVHMEFSVTLEQGEKTDLPSGSIKRLHELVGYLGCSLAPPT